MSELSIFIDESGDIGTNSDFYLLTLVFHEQNSSIEAELAILDEKLKVLGFAKDQAVHTGPIIRKEDEYKNLTLDTRRSAFNRLYAFTRRANIMYKTFTVTKKLYPSRLDLKRQLAKELSSFIGENFSYFSKFKTVIVYYDNGQSLITELISTVLASIFFDFDLRRVSPKDYRLFQSADLLCALELIKAKSEATELSKSEQIFFGNRQKRKKNILNKLEKMHFPAQRK